MDNCGGSKGEKQEIREILREEMQGGGGIVSEGGET